MKGIGTSFGIQLIRAMINQMIFEFFVFFFFFCVFASIIARPIVAFRPSLCDIRIKFHSVYYGREGRHVEHSITPGVTDFTDGSALRRHHLT